MRHDREKFILRTVRTLGFEPQTLLGCHELFSLELRSLAFGNVDSHAEQQAILDAGFERPLASMHPAPLAASRTAPELDLAEIAFGGRLTTQMRDERSQVIRMH